MNKKSTILLSVSLVIASFAVFAIHFMIFHDFHHIMIYTLHDLAFLPLEVLFVSLILHRIIESIQKKHMLNKMNMAIGMFFSECGSELLKEIVNLDDDANEISSALLIQNSWEKNDYRKALVAVEKLEGDLILNSESLQSLKTLLTDNRAFILRLLENPNLLEHEDFTDLLWAVFHLTEELIARIDLSNLPENDLKHVEIDIMRTFKLLVREWLKYMENLKKGYPYLFSMAVRTNPMDKNADPVFH
ncbi:MAG: hypothetical protein PQJ61_17900 [Spirochaetales bacterium]|uniref:Uncharacterized protein n=1 Tax=Candidatus Thalassospirochaeta sargassi TaxID=3119039 RepID=A0AAJ1IKF4_9SPIO|nr:hypothetical protein [Spirochaetales bacterium]